MHACHVEELQELLSLHQRCIRLGGLLNTVVTYVSLLNCFQLTDPYSI